MLTINAEIRKETGTRASRRLRAAGWCPATIYGKNTKSLNIKISYEVISKQQNNKSFYQEIFKMLINKNTINVKLHYIQHHPYKPKLTHIDFIYIL